MSRISFPTANCFGRLERVFSFLRISFLLPFTCVHSVTLQSFRMHALFSFSSFQIFM